MRSSGLLLNSFLGSESASLHAAVSGNGEFESAPFQVAQASSASRTAGETRANDSLVDPGCYAVVVRCAPVHAQPPQLRDVLSALAREAAGPAGLGNGDRERSPILDERQIVVGDDPSWPYQQATRLDDSLQALVSAARELLMVRGSEAEQLAANLILDAEPSDNLRQTSAPDDDLVAACRPSADPVHQGLLRDLSACLAPAETDSGSESAIDRTNAIAQQLRRIQHRVEQLRNRLNTSVTQLLSERQDLLPLGRSGPPRYWRLEDSGAPFLAWDLGVNDVEAGVSLCRRDGSVLICGQVLLAPEDRAYMDAFGTRNVFSYEDGMTRITVYHGREAYELGKSTFVSGISK